MDDILKVSIFNSDLQRDFNLYVRKDRLKAFHEFAAGERHPERVPSMPGLSWSAMLGLDAIFAKRPKHFPVQDIIAFLAGFCTTHSSGAPITPLELEDALERFSVLYPPDISEDA